MPKLGYKIFLCVYTSNAKVVTKNFSPKMAGAILSSFISPKTSIEKIIDTEDIYNFNNNLICGIL